MRNLQLVACGAEPSPHNNQRRMRADRMIYLARELCEQMKLPYDFATLYGEAGMLQKSMKRERYRRRFNLRQEARDIIKKHLDRPEE